MVERIKIYISGAVTNDFNYKEKFKQAEDKIFKMGHIPINPTNISPFLTYEEYMHLDEALIDVCDCLYMLSDWKYSKGAKHEKNYALQKNKLIFYEVADENL